VKFRSLPISLPFIAFVGAVVACSGQTVSPPSSPDAAAPADIFDAAPPDGARGEDAPNGEARTEPQEASTPMPGRALCARPSPESADALHVGDLTLSAPVVARYGDSEWWTFIARFVDPARPNWWLTLKLDLSRRAQAPLTVPFALLWPPAMDSVSVSLREYFGVPDHYAMVDLPATSREACTPSVAIDSGDTPDALRFSLGGVDTLFEGEPRTLRATFTWAPPVDASTP